jgi:hypothetical protein
MKNILSILLVLITVAAACQSSSSDKIEITGIWSLTDYNDSSKFEDTWEFTSDSVFNELKHKSDGDSTLVPDENGIWRLEGIRLKITVTGEDTRGEQTFYEKPQIMEFEITKEGADYILTVISDGGASDGQTTKLRLTKK